MTKRGGGWSVLLATAVLAGAGCASVPSAPTVKRYPSVAAFSRAEPGVNLPGGWQRLSLSRFKRDTEYRLVPDENGVTVVQAEAAQAASGLIKELDVDTKATPWLNWRWKVPQLIAGADNTRRDTEDSPVRVVVTFDGDLEKLDFEERAHASRYRALTGRDMPYATLMYIWENRMPVDALIESRHSSRVQMLVAASGDAQCGKWLNFSRNIEEDFRRAYGETPGRIRSIGIMTDTDNTGELTRAYYGDIKFSAVPPTNGFSKNARETQ